jgi:hypothetical protein
MCIAIVYDRSWASATEALAVPCALRPFTPATSAGASHHFINPEDIIPASRLQQALPTLRRAGPWYLPAICQMGPASQGASCPTGLGNMDNY